MNINTLRYSLFGIAGDQEVDHTFVKFSIIEHSYSFFSLTRHSFFLLRNRDPFCYCTMLVSYLIIHWSRKFGNVVEQGCLYK